MKATEILAKLLLKFIVLPKIYCAPKRPLVPNAICLCARATMLRAKGAFVHLSKND